MPNRLSITRVQYGCRNLTPQFYAAASRRSLTSQCHGPLWSDSRAITTAQRVRAPRTRPTAEVRAVRTRNARQIETSRSRTRRHNLGSARYARARKRSADRRLARSPTRGSSCSSNGECTRRDLRTGPPRLAWASACSTTTVNSPESCGPPRAAHDFHPIRERPPPRARSLARHGPREAWLAWARVRLSPARVGNSQRAAARRHATQWGSRKTSHWVAPCGALRTTEHSTLLLQYSVLPRLFPVASRAPPQAQREALCVPWRPRSSG